MQARPVQNEGSGITASTDDSEMQALFQRLQARAHNLKPVMTEIGLRYERSVMENFKAEQSPDGQPWQRLSAATLMQRLGQKNKKGQRFGFNQKGGLSARGKRYLMGKRILWEHGDLEASVHSQADKNRVVIGTGGHIPYAAIHQFGGQAGRGHKVAIPARPYLAVNRGNTLALAERDRDMIMTLLQKYLIDDLQ